MAKRGKIFIPDSAQPKVNIMEQAQITAEVVELVRGLLARCREVGLDFDTIVHVAKGEQ